LSALTNISGNQCKELQKLALPAQVWAQAPWFGALLFDGSPFGKFKLRCRTDSKEKKGAAVYKSRRVHSLKGNI
jgi:hypothetical protein